MLDDAVRVGLPDGAADGRDLDDDGEETPLVADHVRSKVLVDHGVETAAADGLATDVLDVLDLLAGVVPTDHAGEVEADHPLGTGLVRLCFQQRKRETYTASRQPRRRPL